MRLELRFVKRALLTLGVCAVLCPAAQAFDPTGIFIGGNAGVAQFDANHNLYEDALIGSVAGNGTLVFPDDSLTRRKAAWRFDTGYMLNANVGVIASYLNFGESNNIATGTYAPPAGTTEAVTATTRIRSRGPAVGVLLRLPLTDNLDVNFRLADYYAKTILTNTLNAASYQSTHETKNGSSALAGLGAAYTMFGHWSAHLDYIRVQHAGDSATVGSYNLDLLTVGLSYTF